MTAIESCQSSSVTSCVWGPTRLIPALLTTMSSRPKSRATARRRRPPGCSAPRRSGRPATRRPSVASSSAATRPVSPSISSTATDAPASASSWAMPRPRPVPAAGDDRDLPVEHLHLSTPLWLVRLVHFAAVISMMKTTQACAGTRSHPFGTRPSRPDPLPPQGGDMTISHAAAAAPTRAPARMDGGGATGLRRRPRRRQRQPPLRLLAVLRRALGARPRPRRRADARRDASTRRRSPNGCRTQIECSGTASAASGSTSTPFAGLVDTVAPSLRSRRRPGSASPPSSPVQMPARRGDRPPSSSMRARALHRIRLIKDWDELEKIDAGYELCWLGQAGRRRRRGAGRE